MYVLVFDSNGFLSRHKAVQQGGPASFEVDLPLSNKPRVLHFVSNYDGWAAFDDNAMKMMNEASVLSGMYVSAPNVAYWRRVAVSSISATTNLGIVELMRNVAMVSLVNDSEATASASQDVTSYLTDVTYAAGNYLDKGTVTNFNTVTGNFDDNGIFEAPGASVVPLTSEDGFVAAYNQALSDANGVSLFTYERRNSRQNLSNPFYIVLKGMYHPNSVDPAEPRYYKIDIVNPGQETLLDLQRNRHYILTLGLVMNRGYGTLPEAINGLSLNNVATSVAQSYNSVSDGTSLLNIEYVNRTFVKASNVSAPNDFAIRYSYLPDAKSGATNNLGVTMSWGTEAGYTPAINSVNPLSNNKVPTSPGPPPVYPPGYGDDYVDRVTGKLAGAMPPVGVVAQSFIKIKKDNLSRTIILKLREPYGFEPVSISPSTAAKRAGVPVAITFNIPAALEDQLPFAVYLDDASMLVPALGSKIYHDDSSDHLRYRYTVTRTGEHVLNFTTGSTVGDGRIFIRSELFNEAFVRLYRN